MGIGESSAQLGHERLLPIRQGEKWGFIDETGKERIKPVFDDVDDFHAFDGDLEPVKKGDKWGNWRSWW